MSRRIEVIDSSDVCRRYPAPPATRRFSVLPEDWGNGLLVRMPNHLGDAIMALPALAALKTVVPADCGLVVVAPAGQHRLYTALHDIVDAVVDLDAPHEWWDEDTRRAIRYYGCHVGVMFNNSFRDAISLRRSRVSKLFGYAARCRSLLLADTLPLPPHRRGTPALVHQANLYMRLAEAMGADCEMKMPKVVPTCTADELRGDLRDVCGNGRLLAIGSGAAYGAAKRYPAKHYNRIAEHWLRHGGIVAVVGSASERDIGEEVLAGLPEHLAYNLCGRTNDLNELMLVLKSARAVVANDSGVMHLAAAVGAHGLTVFGPTDHTSTAPLSDKWKLVLSQPECAPCLRHVCPLGTHECMELLEPSVVIRELQKIDTARCCYTPGSAMPSGK
ncbi:MAG: lipopolysaccharide heptosyltransferase II [Victivallaceae bacterium]|nr:lipopolysaccharide heptosyltransferase II [Victivallaceae bacterium]